MIKSDPTRSLSEQCQRGRFLAFPYQYFAAYLNAADFRSSHFQLHPVVKQIVRCRESKQRFLCQF